MKGLRKVILTIITGLLALGGLAVVGTIFKDSTGDANVAAQIYLIYALTITGGLTVFVGGNAFVHFTQMKNNKVKK